MKFDKEMVLKQKFWVMLLLVLPLSVGALFVLVTSVAGDISQTRANIEKDYANFNNVQKRGLKTPEEIAKVEREAAIEKSMESIVWKQAWDMQESCFLWPKQMEDAFDFRNGMFAVKIQFLKGEASADTAKEKDRHLQGEVIEQKGTYMKVRGNDQKVHKIFPSQKVDVEDKTAFGKIKTGTRVAVTFNRGKYFNELLTNAELDLYKRVNINLDQDVYLSQILPIIAQVDPMTEKGEGVVQLAGWYVKPGELPPSYEKLEQSFLNFLDKGFSEDSAGDISEEAWLAQQNLWIQKEVYRLIRLANDYVSKMDLVSAPDKGKVYTFKNPYWELTLKWDGANEVVPTLKNLLSRRQKLDVKFRIQFNKTKGPETIMIGGEPLGPRGSPAKDDVKTFDPIKLPNAEGLRNGIFEVEQVLTWETAAVKRIDQISLGSQGTGDFAHGQRTFADGLDAMKIRDISSELAKKDAGLTGTGLPVVKGGGFGKGKKNLKARAAGNNDLTPAHKLIRNQFWNYLDPNLAPNAPQPAALFRRVPVAVAMIVEQEHIDRVQTAFNNSKLRFLTTLVLLNRCADSLQPQLPKEGVPTGGPPAGSRAGRGGSSNPDSLETNYEMVLYGIMTLYERYPPPVTQ